MKKIVLILSLFLLSVSLNAKSSDEFYKDYKKYHKKKDLQGLKLEKKMLYLKLMGQYDKAFLDLKKLILNNEKEQDFYLRILYAIKDNLMHYSDYFEFLKNFVQTHPQSELAKLFLSQEYLRVGDKNSSLRLRKQLNIITNLLGLAPFDNEKGAGLDTPYPPEYDFFNFTNHYQGKIRTISWRTLFSSPLGRIKPDNFYRPYKEVTGYFGVFLYVDKDSSGELKISINTPMKIWVNQNLVYTNSDKHSFSFDQFTVPIFLSQGWNYLVLKSANPSQESWKFILRLSGFDVPIVQSVNIAHADNINLDMTKKLSLQKNDDSILEYFYSLTNKSKDTDMAYFNLGYYLYLLQSTDKYDNIPGHFFGKALDIKSNYSLYQYYFGMAQGSYRYSKKYWSQCLKLNVELIEPKIQLLNYYNNLNYTEQTLEWLNQFSVLPTSLVEFAFDFYRKKNMPSMQKKILESNSKKMEQSPTYYYKRALFYFDRYSSKQAIDSLKKALALNYLYVDARDFLVQLYKERGDISNALYVLNTGLDLFPDSIELYERKASLFENIKQYEIALPLLDKAKKICPEDFYLNFKLGEIHHFLNHKRLARQYFQEAYKLKPNEQKLKKYLDFLYPTTNLLISLSTDWQDSYHRENYKDTVILLKEQVIEVYKDGTSTSLVHFVIQLNSDTAIEKFQKRNLFFNPENEQVEILKARVYDSSLNYVDADEVGEYSYGGANAYLFYNLKYKHIVFPKLVKGAIIELEYLQHTTKNLFGNNYFGDSFTFQDFYPIKKSSYTLIADKKQKFYTHVRKNDNIITKREFIKKEKKILIYSAKNIKKLKKELGMPPSGTLSPTLVVSTLKDWSYFGNWLSDLFKYQLKSDDFIKTKVQELTQNLQKKEEKIKAIYQYIVSQVRYVGLEFGLGAIQPRQVTTILSTGYGDCKDKASLMVAMLKEIGVPSYVALVRTHDKGYYDYALPFLGAFDHAICYVDYKGGFFLDGTADFYSYKVLPYNDYNIDMFILDGKKSRFVKPQIMQTKDNQEIIKTKIQIKENGSAVLHRFIQKIGQSASSFRYYFQSLNNQDQYLNQYWNQIFPGAVVKNIQFSSLSDLTINPYVSYDVLIPQYVDMSFEEPVLKIIPMKQPFTTSYAPDSRKRVYPLELQFPWMLKETVDILLPKKMSVVALPQSVSSNGKYIDYKMSVTQDKTIKIHNVIVLKNPIIPSGDYKKFRATMIHLDALQDTKIYLKDNMK